MHREQFEAVSQYKSWIEAVYREHAEHCKEVGRQVPSRVQFVAVIQREMAKMGLDAYTATQAGQEQLVQLLTNVWGSFIPAA